MGASEVLMPRDEQNQNVQAVGTRSAVFSEANPATISAQDIEQRGSRSELFGAGSDESPRQQLTFENLGVEFEPEIQEIGQSSAADVASADSPTGNLNAMKIAVGFLLENDDLGRAQIIQKNVPGTEIVRITENEWGVRLPATGKTFSLNKKGLSPQDVIDFTTEIAKFAPASQAAAAATTGSSILTKAAAQTLGGVATEVMSNAGASFAGGKPMDFNRDLGEYIAVAVGSGLGTVAGEAVLPAIGKTIVKIFTGAKLNKQEIAELVDLGFDPNEISPEGVKRIIMNRGKGTKEEREAMLQGLAQPVPVVQTAGQITGKGDLQLIEELALRGNMDDLATRIMTTSQDAQEQAIAENIALITTRAGGNPTGNPAAIGSMIQRKLTRIKNDLGEDVKNAYSNASNAGAFFGSGTRGVLAGKFNQVINDLDVDIDDLPHVKKFMDGLLDDAQTKDTAFITLADMERYRKRINANILDKAANKAELKIGAALKEKYDEMVEAYVDGGLISGDENAIALMKAAREKSAYYNSLFKDKNIVQKLTRKESYMKDAELAIDPDLAINYILGRDRISGGSGVSGIKQLKKVLPESEFSLLKEAMLLKLAQKGQGKKFNVAKFGQNTEAMFRLRPELMKELYSPKELRFVKGLGQVAERISSKDAATRQATSNLLQTSVVRDAGRFFGKTGLFLTSLLKQIPGVSAASQAAARSTVRSQASGLLPGVSSGVPGIVAPSIAAAGLKETRENVKQNRQEAQ